MVIKKENRREFYIEKVDGYGIGKNNCWVSAEIGFEDGCFSATASLWNHIASDVMTCGQCFGSLLNEFPQLGDNKIFMEIYKLWADYHLNDMHAGTPAQEKAIKEWEAAGNKYDYREVCEYLKSINLYEVPISTIDIKYNPDFEGKEGTYKYGHGWIMEGIPAADIDRINSLLKDGQVKEKELNEKQDVDSDYEMEM